MNGTPEFLADHLRFCVGERTEHRRPLGYVDLRLRLGFDEGEIDVLATARAASRASYRVSLGAPLPEAGPLHLNLDRAQWWSAFVRDVRLADPLLDQFYSMRASNHDLAGFWFDDATWGAIGRSRVAGKGRPCHVEIRDGKAQVSARIPANARERFTAMLEVCRRLVQRPREHLARWAQIGRELGGALHGDAWRADQGPVIRLPQSGGEVVVVVAHAWHDGEVPWMQMFHPFWLRTRIIAPRVGVERRPYSVHFPPRDIPHRWHRFAIRESYLDLGGRRMWIYALDGATPTSRLEDCARWIAAALPAQIVARENEVIVTLDGAIDDERRLEAAVELSRQLAGDPEQGATPESPYR